MSDDAFKRWLKRRQNFLDRRPVKSGHVLVREHNETHVEIKQDRLRLIKTLKHRYPNKHPLDLAEMFFRYHRLHGTYKTGVRTTITRTKNNGTMNAHKINKQLSEKEITYQDVADYFGITEPAVWQWFDREMIPKNRQEGIRKLIKQTEKKKVKNGKNPDQKKPITLGEVAKKTQEPEPEPEKRDTGKKEQPFRMPSIKELTEIDYISISTANKIREHLRIPMLFMSECLGESSDWWSRYVRTKKRLTNNQSKKVQKLLVELSRLSLGGFVVDEQEGKIKEDIIEALTMLEELTDTIPNKINRRVVSSYLKEIAEEIETL